VEIWEKTWAKCEEMGAVVIRRASAAAQYVNSPAPFTQESLVTFVDVIKGVRSISRAFGRRRVAAAAHLQAYGNPEG